MRIAIVGGLAALVLAALVSVAAADIGPPDPARKICMGKPAGEPCTYKEKAGTCQGPHPSRMYCVPPKAGEGSATSTDTGSATPAPATPAPATPAPVTPAPATPAPATPAADVPSVDPKPAADPSAEPAPSPGHKRGCAVAQPGSAAVLAIAALALLRRRRSRSR